MTPRFFIDRPIFSWVIAIGILLLGPTGNEYIPGISYVGLAMLWTAALVTLYTGYDYFRTGVVFLMEESHDG